MIVIKQLLFTSLVCYQWRCWHCSICHSLDDCGHSGFCLHHCHLQHKRSSLDSVDSLGVLRRRGVQSNPGMNQSAHNRCSTSDTCPHWRTLKLQYSTTHRAYEMLLVNSLCLLPTQLATHQIAARDFWSISNIFK